MARASILNDLTDLLDISVMKFERTIGVKPTIVAQAIKRNSELKISLIDKIVAAYPSVNRDGLILGRKDLLIRREEDLRDILKIILKRLDSIEDELRLVNGKSKTVELKPKRKVV